LKEIEFSRKASNFHRRNLIQISTNILFQVPFEHFGQSFDFGKTRKVKFTHSEKAKKFCEISTVDLTGTT
jgi:hypothetical protein